METTTTTTNVPATTTTTVQPAAPAAPLPKTGKGKGKGKGTPATTTTGATTTTVQPAAPAAPPEGKTELAPQQEKPAAPVAPPAENAAEIAARKEATDKAILLNRQRAESIADKWAAADRSAKVWMVEMGAACQDYLTGETALNVPYKEAMSNLRVRVRATTGEDKGTDITRCLKVYFAAVLLGRDEFAKLPLRGQKEFATALSAWENTKTKAMEYLIDMRTADLTRAAFAYALALPAGSKECNETMERTKDGTLTGESCAALVAAIKAGVDPFAVQPAAPTTTTTTTTTASKEASKATTTTTGKEQDATGERPSGQAPAVKLDVKPAIAAADLIRGLTEHDTPLVIMEALGKAKEIGKDYVEGLILGMLTAGRIDEVRSLAAFIMRELKIASFIGANKGASRAQAISAIDNAGARMAS